MIKSLRRYVYQMITEVLSYFLSTLPQTNELRVGKKENGESFSTFSVSVPRPGIEPGWVAPLVFETSASTDSAIWAFLKCDAKVRLFF